MANFETAYNKVLGAEGGYSNVSSDLGGETYAGISRVYNPGWSGWAIIDGYKTNYPGGIIPRYTKFNDAALSAAIKDFYKKTQWDVIYGDKISSQSVAEILFDARVNQTGGLGFMLSNALNKSGKPYKYYSAPATKLPVTQQMIADTNSVPAADFFNRFKTEREKYYTYRAAIPGQEGNLTGWMNRLKKITFQDVTNNLATVIVIVMVMAGAVYLIYTHFNYTS
jgi:hypothetical protein